MELERMMARQREMEAEQEEQRRKMVEQREVRFLVEVLDSISQSTKIHLKDTGHCW